MRSNVRNLLAMSAVLALPLAAVPFQNSAEDRVNDGKAARMHELLDQAKAERVAEAMAFDASGIPQPAAAPCTAGFAGPYPCSNIDLAAVVPLAELGGAAGNDSWGWTDPVEGNEIAIIGTGTGVAFVDVTEPTAPVVLGRVNGAGGTEGSGASSGSLWRDLKVNDDHVYIVSEVSGSGMQVFDLTRLRDRYGARTSPVREFEVDAFVDDNSSAHNIAINEDTDRAYIVGGDVADGGLFIYDISNPTEPEVIGQFAADGYTHDVQCVLYDGPDDEFNGNNPDGYQAEICFASNEDTVTIVDVTDAAKPVEIAKIGYPTAAYTHQGWLTPDKSWFVFNDELDEDPVLGDGTVSNTTTYMVNVEDLRDAADPDGSKGHVKSYAHDSISIDHNLYITDDGLIWEANYNAGLRVLKEGPEGFENGDLQEVGYFETDPVADAKAYGDSWNVYPFFESGTVVVSNLGQGLVVLTPNYEALRGDGS